MKAICKMCTKPFIYYGKKPGAGTYCSRACCHTDPEWVERQRRSHLGRRLSPTTRQRMSEARRGIVMSPERRGKIAAAHLARYDQGKSLEMVKLFNAGATETEIAEQYGLTPSTIHHHLQKHKALLQTRKHVRKDEDHPDWRGDQVGYSALHKYVQSRLSKPEACSNCGDTTGRIELANKSGNYLRDLDDWLWLCSKCHHEYDRIGERLRERGLERRLAKTECANGHSYAEYGYYSEKGLEEGRRCRKCQSIASARYYRSRHPARGTLRGEQLKNSKLTVLKVANIKHMKGSLTAKEIAALYGVSTSAVTLIWCNINWKHVC